MGMEKFRALWVEEIGDGRVARRVVERDIDQLPPNEVLVRVLYSSLNYKDALSANGNRGVTRVYPHTPGIDAAGLVEESASPLFAAGDKVLAAAPELGVSIPGGFGQFVRVPAARLFHLPVGLTLRESMMLGTAGYTAAMMIAELVKNEVRSDSGDILVTGATGGVGSLGVAILAKIGYHVVAATSKTGQIDYLKRLGAGEVISSDAVNDKSDRALLSARWAGVLDTVGGNYLSTAIRGAKPGGVVTACGNAASPELHLTVFPFILRGVRLIGADATQANSEERVKIWQKLAADWKPDMLESMVREVNLDGLSAEIDTILRGGQIGRVLVNLRG